VCEMLFVLAFALTALLSGRPDVALCAGLGLLLWWLIHDVEPDPGEADDVPPWAD
jgi:hypothetical protein